MADDALYDQLRARILELEEQVRQLQAQQGATFDCPPQLRFTPSQQRMFGVLMGREIATKDALLKAHHRNDHDDEPEIKIVDVQICKMRMTASPLGVEIKTVWGQGYYLTGESKALVREMLSARAAA